MECNKYLDKLSSIGKVFEKYEGTDVLIAQAIKLIPEFFDIKQIRKPINKLITQHTAFLYAHEIKENSNGIESPLYHTLPKITYYSHENENKILEYVKVYTERVENMIEAGADVSVGIKTNYYNESLLYYCIQNNISNTIIKKLLEKNVDVNDGFKKINIRSHAEDIINISCLEIAIKNKQYELAHILLERGADPNHKYEYFYSFHRYDRYSTKYSTALNMAIEVNNIELVKHLLEKGADINKIYLNRFEDMYHNTLEITTPIIRAIMNKNIEIVKLLIERKPDFNIRYKKMEIFDMYDFITNDFKYEKEGIHILNYIDIADVGGEIYKLIKKQNIKKKKDPFVVRN
jgi:ankyrin repeat protein